MTQVLFVEDNLAVLESVAFELQMRGYEVATATNGFEALQLLQQLDLPPDIIVSDIAMPDMDGYKLLESVHADDRWNGIPFIFLTAFGSPNAVRIGKELGVDDYLVKPFQPDDLVLAMENKLKRIRDFRRSAYRQLDSARQELLTTFSHELRTPLTAIYGGAEILADSLESLPDHASVQMVELIRNGARRMNHLINQMLYMVQIDSGQLQSLLDKKARLCDMTAVVQHGFDRMKQEWEPHIPDVNVVFDISDTPLWVEGIEDYLAMAVMELGRNAVMFSPAGETIIVTVQADAATVNVVVEDHGIGIAEADLSRVWERFVQINREHYEQQGVGLGLALVSDITRLHGGTCAIESQPGKGTRATLRLPLAILPGADQDED